MNRYSGTVISVDRDHGDFAFIDAKSVRKLDGTLPNLGDLDIFVHHSECQSRLLVGQKLTFAVEPDHKREGAFRASGARDASKYPLEGAVEVHFDERVVDHPMVPIRWCIKPEILRLMRETPDKIWYLAIVAQHSTSPSKTVLHTVVGMDRIGDGRDYLTFNGPGEYDLAVYLVRSDLSENRFRKDKKDVNESRINIWDDRESYVLSTDGDSLRFFNEARETIISHSFMMLEVPSGIFAKPLPAWVKNWLGYFGLSRPRDECSMRGRLALAFTLGPVLYVVWEFVKRLYMLILGVVHFVFGGNPLPVWEAAFSPQLSAYISNLRGEYEYESLMEYEDWKRLFHPSIWLVLGGVAAFWAFVPGSHGPITAAGVLIAVIAILIATVVMAGHKIQDYLEKRRAAKGKRHTEEVLARVEAFAVCGRIPAKGPTTVRLAFSGIKRMVCRTYA